MAGIFTHHVCFSFISLASFFNYLSFQTSDVYLLLAQGLLSFLFSINCCCEAFAFPKHTKLLYVKNRDFRKCNKQLLIHLSWVLFWSLFTSIFWLGLHMQGIQTPHIIQRNLLSAVTFSKYALISPNSNIYFVWWKTAFISIGI